MYKYLYGDSTEFPLQTDLPHVVYANFGRYFNRIVSEADNPISNPEIIEICKFLDEMAIWGSTSAVES